MPTNYSITESFGVDLAKLLGKKIRAVYPSFNFKAYNAAIKKKCVDKTYTQRVVLHAQELRSLLPESYKEALAILMQILGDENPEQTGMFTNFYWLLPVGKFVELYGLDDYSISIKAISEITKRNTGEYAIRPYVRKYPEKTIKVMDKWARSKSFHLRRLASEGLRPKLPWAPKLDTFIADPKPVFAILEQLKEDEIMFVKKSVGNHLTDYLKVNPDPTIKLMRLWKSSDNVHTQWILKRANRKLQLDI